MLEDKQIELSGAGVFNFWQTFSDRSPDDVTGRGAHSFTFFPDAGGTQFRLFAIPAADPAVTPEQIKDMADGFFKFIGWPGARRDTSRHPFMHVTPTVDYILLLSGEISLVLDEGDPIPLKPFDAVVQRGTNHRWLNTGKTTALLMAVMVGRNKRTQLWHRLKKPSLREVNRRLRTIGQRNLTASFARRTSPSQCETACILRSTFIGLTRPASSPRFWLLVSIPRNYRATNIPSIFRRSRRGHRSGLVTWRRAIPGTLLAAAMCKSLPSLEVISSPTTGARGIGIALTSSNGLRGSLGAAPPSSFTLRASESAYSDHADLAVPPRASKFSRAGPGGRGGAREIVAAPERKFYRLTSLGVAMGPPTGVCNR